jgi:hypothetical protein
MMIWLTKPRLVAGVALSGALALGAMTAPAGADWDHGGHYYHHGWTGGYYGSPAVVFGGPWGGYGYYPPPVVYGPGFGVTIGIR